mmetsp:Transcript_24887/g.28772  ORF Transcript_24887/g.28772 Transcript_24887/m.28772 type:complete len:576 (+) Transcript_24887:18-1745(+)
MIFATDTIQFIIERTHKNKKSMSVNDRNDIRALLAQYPCLASNNEQGLVEELQGDALTIVRKNVRENHQPNIQILNALIMRFPEELGYSLLMATIRFPTYSIELMNRIFDAIDTYYDNYWIDEDLMEQNQYHIDLSEIEIVVSEALKWAFMYDCRDTIQWSGNLHAIKLIRQEYPKSILTEDEHYSPLAGLCYERTHVDLKLIRYFIEWYVDIDKDIENENKGGLFQWVDVGQLGVFKPVWKLLTKSQPIIPLLEWIQCRGLMFRSFGDDKKDFLFECLTDKDTPVENIQFLLHLHPKSILSEIYTDDYYDPIQMLLQDYTDFGRTKIEGHNSFEQFLDKFKLLLRYGLNYGLNDFGGLFNLQSMEDDNTIGCAHYAVGNEDGRLLLCQAISDCLNDLGADYEYEPIIHAAIDSRKKYIKKTKSKEGWLMILNHFGSQDQLPQYHANMHGDLPLHHALKVGLSWDDGLSDIVNHFSNVAIVSVDVSTGLYPFMLAAAGESNDSRLNTTFRFLKEGPIYAQLYGSCNEVSQPNDMNEEIIDGGDEVDEINELSQPNGMNDKAVDCGDTTRKRKRSE